MMNRIWKNWLMTTVLVFVLISGATYLWGNRSICASNQENAIDVLAPIHDTGCVLDAGEIRVGWPAYYHKQTSNFQGPTASSFDPFLFFMNIIITSFFGLFIAWFIDWLKVRRAMRVKG